MKLKPIVLLLSFVATLSLLSCGSKKGENKGAEDFDKAKQSIPEEIQGLADEELDPTQIPYLLQSTGAEYNQSLTNDRKFAQGYMSKSEKAAINLGVYAGDLAYASSYEKTQEAIDYLKTCKGLADNLGLTNSFPPEMLKKFEDFIGNRDTLAVLLKKAIRDSKTLLKGDNQSKLAVLIVTGGFVEGLYIATGVVKTYPKDLLPTDQKNLILTPLMQLIVNQKKQVEKVTEMMTSVEQTGSVPGILQDLKALKASYEALNFSEQLKKNPKMILTDQTLADITAKIEKLRGDIVAQ